MCGGGRRLEAGGGGGAEGGRGGGLSGVRRGGEGAQPPGLWTLWLRQIRLQTENTHLLLLRGRRGRKGGGEAVS